MVAIMIMTTGLLALASTAAVVVRQMGGAQQLTLAATVAQARFERIRARGDCNALPSAVATGTATAPGGVTETWWTTEQLRVIQVKDSVSYQSGSERQAKVYYTTIPCSGATP